MTERIKKIGVIGAGTMGSGIAAQAANGGLEVVLLDLKKADADKAIQRMLAAKPTDAFNAGFMHVGAAKNITTGNSPGDFAMLADCDMIIMSILAPVKVRQNVFREIQKVARKDAIFSDNTSMDPTADIVEGMDDDFKKRFLNTHFFNPVRFMHLLEIIPGEKTDPAIIDAVVECGDKDFGKKIVLCKDDRGFIANRDGMFPIKRAKTEAVKLGLTVEDVDAIMSTAFGFPKVGVFRLADEVGLDVVEHVSDDLHKHLPADDAFHAHYNGHDEIKDMLAAGYFGNRKADSKGGYYRKKPGATAPNGKPVFEYRDLTTGEYHEAKGSRFKDLYKDIRKAGGFAKFFDSSHEAAKFAWPVLRDTLIYALDHAEDHAHDIQSVDDAMRAGFNWKWGPFELIDQFGADWFRDKLEAEGIKVPQLLHLADGSFYREKGGKLEVMDFEGNYAPVKREDGVVNLDDIKRASKPIVTHHSASLWDIGDGIVCLEFHSKQNSIDPSTLWVINESIRKVAESNGKYKGMVVYNDGVRFSVGANLALAEVFMNVADNKYAKMLGIAGMAERGLKGLLHELIYQGQAVYTALNQAPFPVIGAPKGSAPKSASEVNLALGGGCEVLLNCDAIQAGPEQVMALPEMGLGILPAWTGSARYLERCFEKANTIGPRGPMAPVVEAGLALANPLSSMSSSSHDAKAKLWLRPTDGITMNPDRVLADAKAKALEMAKDYKPKPLPVFYLPGADGKATIRMNVDKMYKAEDDPKAGGVNHVDLKAADRLADVLTGGDTVNIMDVMDDIANNHDHYFDLMDERDTEDLPVHSQMPLTYSRILQLERDRILDAFNDRAATWPRVRHTLKTNSYLREKLPVPAPEPKDLRARMKPESLPPRVILGEPLRGNAAKTLRAMADMTAEFYRQRESGTWTATALQTPRTLTAVGRVMRLVS